MKRQWLIIAASILALVFIGLVVKAKFFSKPSPGALRIASTPKTTVFLDGAQLGITPLSNDEIIPGEHLVRLVPEAAQNNFVSWEGKVIIASNVMTVISRELAPSEASSSGEILSLEKIGKKNSSSLAVVSIPDQAVVKINGEPKGFTPLQQEDLAPGDYQVTISSTGYRERTIPAHTIAGYKLTLNVKLAQEIGAFEEKKAEEEKVATASPTPSPKTTLSPSVTPPEKPYIKVKETPTGWLRVRMGPSSTATEAAKINPGEMYSYLDEEENGWYKIEYAKDKEGWVSSTYVELVK